MAVISALLSLLSRKLGDLLQALFGWSITGLFGRLPSKKQTALSLALILSIVWPLLVIGCFLPKAAAWMVAFVPLHHLLGERVLRGIWIALAVLSPIIVGLITSWVAPSSKQRGGLLRTVLTGYPLTLGLFLSFLMTFFIMPVIKLISMARRWEDEHVYVQVKEGAYCQVLHQLAAACNKAGIAVFDMPVPGIMRAPTRVLKWFAASGLDPIIASDPRMLRGKEIELYLYPADLMIRGTAERTRRVRAALVREMMQAPAYLTQEPKAQFIEDELTAIWEQLGRNELSPEVLSALPGRIRAIAKALDAANVPYDDWLILYTDLHRLEHEVHGESRLVDEKRSPAREEVAMTANDPTSDVSTLGLVKEAIDETRALLKTEIALTRSDVQRELAAVKRVAIAMGAAAVAAILGLSMLLMAMVTAIAPRPLTASITGIVLLVAAGVIAAVGYSSLPKKPLEPTQERLQADARVLKEGIA